MPFDAPPDNVQTEWARCLITSVARAGVRHAVISPGSRSTPLVLAASEEPSLQCFDVVDERAAGYFALGLARITAEPALLLCTSGTAAANYLPAVVEAGGAHVPLLVLTADRPVELAHCGANQTIDQLKLFGQQARRFFDLGTAESTPLALRGLRRTATQAVFACKWPEPGAVHLNARLRKPLEPAPQAADADAGTPTLIEPVPTQGKVRPTAPRQIPPAQELDDLAEVLQRSARGVLVCGPAPVQWGAWRREVATLASRAGLVVFADPASQQRFASREEGAVFVDGFDALLHSATFDHFLQPDLIVQIGRSPTSGVWERRLGQLAGIEHRVLLPYGWHDPMSTATGLHFGDVDATLEGLLDRLPAQPSPSNPWLEGCRTADALAQSVAEEELVNAEEFSEGAVAQAVVSGLPTDGLLVLGNSLPIRQVDTWCRRHEGLRVASQRGASGIDGVVAGAAGAARAHGGPAALLVGDVSFLHDLSGLSTVRQVESPLAVVVVQNHGGRIFEQLPVATHPAVPKRTLDHWFTPHEDDFSGAATLYGLPFQRVYGEASLRKALAAAWRHPGATVIEAVVPPHGAAEQNQRYWKRLEVRLVEEMKS